LLRDLLPKAALIGALVNPNNLQAKAISKDLDDGARALGLQLRLLPVSSSRDIDSTFVNLAEQRVDAVLVAPDQLFNAGRRKLVTLASRHALPTIFIQRQFVTEGGLLSYGPSLTDSYRHAGIYVGRILKGDKPADLPVMLPTKFELAINLRTARALGLEVPPMLLARADEVIE
jgi:putative ABC transport system substrate-binding protein